MSSDLLKTVCQAFQWYMDATNRSIQQSEILKNKLHEGNKNLSEVLEDPQAFELVSKVIQAYFQNVNVRHTNLKERTEILDKQDNVLQELEDFRTRTFFLPPAKYEHTFAIIKPNGYLQREMIRDMIESAGFRVVNQKTLNISTESAALLYAEHQGKSFYDGLIEFITEGPSVLMVLEKENAIQDWRTLIGPPSLSERTKYPGCLRSLFGSSENVTRNGLHGSDSFEAAQREMGIFDMRLDNDKDFIPSPLPITSERVRACVMFLSDYDFHPLEEMIALCKIRGLRIIRVTKPEYLSHFNGKHSTQECLIVEGTRPNIYPLRLMRGVLDVFDFTPVRE
jgi:nucleoside-diphosphate kinase